MATQKVLNLPELLEAILLQLPIRDLLFAQKICRTWKTTINTSPAVKKALFFAPGTVNDVRYNSPNHKSVAQCLADGQSASPSDYAAAQECAMHMRVVRSSHFAMKPLLMRQSRTTKGLDFQPGPFRRGADPQESWSRMFATQPPGSTHMEVEVVGPGERRHAILDTQTEPGEKFGLLVEEYRKFVEKTFERQKETKRAREGPYRVRTRPFHPSHPDPYDDWELFTVEDADEE
ncbi:hypothetical protein LTR27_003760 [Elasticomyces elasticus]|nr:hypothetical protein LTR27_003760 [Elasticomyces elasticus]